MNKANAEHYKKYESSRVSLSNNSNGYVIALLKLVGFAFIIGEVWTENSYRKSLEVAPYILRAFPISYDFNNMANREIK